MRESIATGGRVVVGVDGSEHAGAALRYAVEEAARRGAAVEAVAAFEPPEAWAFAYGVAVLPDGGERRRAVAEQAGEWADDVRAALPAALRDVPVTVSARTGTPAEVLLGAASDAALLVVGHRGRGPLRSTVLGSVGLSCVLHAPCPVTVVPADRVAAPGVGAAAEASRRPVVAGPAV